MKSVIVSTELAVVFLVREGVSPDHARRALYRWSRQGKLTNHGGGGRGQARWDLREVKILRDSGVYG